jgi:hypothetical protein
MRFRIPYVLLYLFLLLFVQQSAKAQQYPVTASTQVIPPYSVYLPDYAVPGSDKLRVILIQNDLTQPSYDVILQMRVEQNGTLIMRTSAAFHPRPLTLTSGVPTIISGSDLSEYLSTNNIEFSGGFSRENYDRTKALPEGAYRITFTAFDYRRPAVQVSNAGANVFFFQKNDPPLLNLPVCGSRVEKHDPQFLSFNWSSRNTPNSSTEYIFSLYEIKPKNTNADYIVRSAQPLYTLTTESNTLIYGPGEPQLIDSMEYVWVVQARDKNGRDLFSNQGYSQSCKFTYLGTNPFQALNINKPVLYGSSNGERSAKFWWPLAARTSQYSVETYRIQYRAAGGDFDWYTEEKDKDSTLTLHSLEPGRRYEARLQWRVSGVYGPYSELVTVTTDSLRVFSCGDGNQLKQPDNSQPLPSAIAGNIVRIGNFDVMLTQVSGGEGVFSGTGRVITPGFGMGLPMMFNGISINTDYVVIRGEMQAVTSGIDQFVSDELKNQRGGDDVGQVKTGDIVPDITTKLHLFTKDNIAIDTAIGRITLKDGKGGEQVIDYVKQGKKLPIVIEDADGHIFNIDKNGTVTDAGIRDKSISTATLNNLDLSKGRVTFSASPGNKYAFDAWKDAYSGKAVLDSSYELIGTYRVSAKAIVPGVQESVIATVDGSLDTSKIKFVSGKGIVYPFTKDGYRYTVTITGGPGGDAQEVYAVCDGKSVSKLLVVSYVPKQRKVVLIPIGSTVVPEAAIKSSLEKAYASIGITYTVETDVSFRDYTDTLLQDSKSAFLSNSFTGDEKAMKKAYVKSHSIADDVVYLFVVNEAVMSGADLLGKMPRQSQFGFIFVKGASTEDIGRAVAHETGHGAYTLEHTFSSGIGLSQGSSDNLMDYANGYALLKYQWDAVHDPGHVWGIFEGDAESEQQKVLLEALLKWIIDNKGKESYFNYNNYFRAEENEAESGFITNTIKLGGKDVDIYADIFGQGMINLVKTDNAFSINSMRISIKILALGKEMAYGSDTKNIPFKDSYSTTFYLGLFYKSDANSPAIQLYTHSYEDFLLLLQKLGLDIDGYKPAINSLYKKAITLAGKDCDKLDVVFESIPPFVMEETDDALKWQALSSLSNCLMDENGTNEEKAILNLIHGFSDEHLLFDSLRKNPSLVMDIWYGLDGESSDVYNKFLLNLATSQWTESERTTAENFVYWGEGFDTFKKLLPVNEELLLQVAYRSASKDLSVINTFGSPNLIPDTYQQGTPVGKPFTCDLFQPVKMIFDNKDYTVNVPGIFLYYAGTSKNLHLAKGKMLEWLTYAGAAGSFNVLASGETHILLKAVAFIQLIKIPVDQALADPSVRAKMDTSFLHTWPYISIGLDVTLISTDLVFRFVKSSAAASSALRESGYAGAADDLDNMAREIGVQVEAQIAKEAAVYIDDALELERRAIALAGGDLKKVEAWLSKLKDDNIYIIVHGEGSSFTIMRNGIELPMTHRSLARWIKDANIPADKQIVLLSCSDLKSAQDLSNSAKRAIIATEGKIKVYENGVIEAENPFMMMTRNAEPVPFAKKIGNTGATVEKDAVRLGSAANEEVAIAEELMNEGKLYAKFIKGKSLVIFRKKLYGGPIIKLFEKRTTTITGTLDDVNSVAFRGGLSPGLTEMGANPGGINILRSPKWTEIQAKYNSMLEAGDELGYWKNVTDEFWETVNKPWLDEAITRGDAFRFVSDPKDINAIFVTKNKVLLLDKEGNRIQSVFGREVEYLESKGYTFMPDGTAIKK